MELEHRDKMRDLAAVRLFAHLIAAGLGVQQKYLLALLDEYTVELFQHRYDPEAMKAVTRLIKARSQAEVRVDDMELLQKVGKADS